MQYSFIYGKVRDKTQKSLTRKSKKSSIIESLAASIFNVSGLNSFTLTGILTERQRPAMARIKEKHKIKWFVCTDCKCYVTIPDVICSLTQALAV